MKKIIDRIVDYSDIEVAEIPLRFMKLVEEVGEWSAAYLELVGFKVKKTPKTEEELVDHILEEGADSLIMVYDVLFKQGYTTEQIEAKMVEKLDVWEEILVDRGLVFKLDEDKVVLGNLI